MKLRLSITAWALLATLVVAIAGLVHIGSVLALPWRSQTDAFSRIATLVDVSERVTLAEGGHDALPFHDPVMLTDVCRFDLRVKPFRLALSPFEDGFVSIGFHSRHGIAFYGLTVGATDATAFDLTLDTKADAAGAGQARDTHRVVVIAPEPECFVTVSTPIGEGSEHEAAETRLARMECRSDPPTSP